MKKLDVLYKDAVFHTMRSEGDTARYLGVSGGSIAYIGNEPPELPAKKTVSLLGGHVYPALTDAHLHLIFAIMAGRGVAACEMVNGKVLPDTVAGVCARLKEFASDKPKNEMIVATGYIASAVAERRLPNRFELDEACGGRPVTVYNFDAHSTALSTAMLERMKLPIEGDGILTGAANEERQGLITNTIAASVTPGALIRGLAAFTNDCASWGVGRVCALEGNADDEKDFVTSLAVWLARRMKLSVRMYFQYQDVERAKKYRRVQSKPRIGGCGEWEMDGAVGSHSAAFYAPYKDTGEAHELYNTDARVKEITEAAEREGYYMGSHAIGTRAIDQLIDALYALNSKRMHRIEHFLFPSKHAVELADGRIAAVIQPGYDYVDERYLHSYSNYMPQELIDLQLPLKTLYDKGVCICGSSDCPVQPVDPYLQMLGMRQFGVPGESLSPYEALTTYTVNPARVLDELDTSGTLETGKRADFFVAAQDILTLPNEALAGFRVDAMYLAGKKYKPMKGSLPELIGMLFKKPKLI